MSQTVQKRPVVDSITVLPEKEEPLVVVLLSLDRVWDRHRVQDVLSFSDAILEWTVPSPVDPPIWSGLSRLQWTLRIPVDSPGVESGTS